MSCLGGLWLYRMEQMYKYTRNIAYLFITWRFYFALLLSHQFVAILDYVFILYQIYYWSMWWVSSIECIMLDSLAYMTNECYSVLIFCAPYRIFYAYMFHNLLYTFGNPIVKCPQSSAVVHITSISHSTQALYGVLLSCWHASTTLHITWTPIRLFVMVACLRFVLASNEWKH